MSQFNRKQHSLFFPLVVFVLAGIPATHAAAASGHVPVLDKTNIKYPETCQGVSPLQSGLCLLTSLKSKVDNDTWLIRTKDQSMASRRFIDRAVTPNVFQPLAPGDYLLYAKDGLDSGGFELLFTVEAGSVKTIKTSAYKASGKGFAIRHFKPSSGVNGAGCTMRHLDTKPSDVLPGNYLVYKTDLSQATPPCPPGGVASNALAGQAQTISSRKRVNQEIPKSNRYRHPDGISSLTSISQFRDDIHEISILSNWISYNGITSPYRTKLSALVLSGIGTRTYVIPLTIKKDKSGCGRSLAMAGLASMPVLTECKFVGDRLSDFKVRAGGSYFTFNNRHGVTAIEGNNINNSILVKGLAAAIK